MALITCPECGKEISDKATTCPNCGAPVNTTNTPDPVPQPNTNYSEKYRSPQNDKSGKNSKLGITALVLSIIGCTFIFGIICAIIDLTKKDGRKKTCSIIALCVGVFWLIMVIVANLSNRNTSQVTVSESIVEESVPAQTQETLIAETDSEIESQVTSEVETEIETETESETVSTTPTESKDDFIASCQQIPYKDLLRNPDDYIGQRIVITAKVQQVVQGGWLDNNEYYRVQTDNDGYDWYMDDEYFMYDYRVDDNTKILQDDILKIYAEFSGVETITRALTGAKDEVPSIKAYYIDLIGE